MRVLTPPSDLITIAHAARELNVSYSVLYDKVMTGKVPSIRAYGARYIERAFLVFLKQAGLPRRKEGVEL